MSTQPRQPKGTPVGGRFASESRNTGLVDLSSPAAFGVEEYTGGEPCPQPTALDAEKLRLARSLAQAAGVSERSAESFLDDVLSRVLQDPRSATAFAEGSGDVVITDAINARMALVQRFTSTYFADQSFRRAVDRAVLVNLR